MQYANLCKAAKTLFYIAGLELHLAVKSIMNYTGSHIWLTEVDFQDNIDSSIRAPIFVVKLWLR